MKQTKNQTSTYSCAGQKLTVKAEYISYQRFFGYKFESIIISSAQNSVFYTSCLATMCPVCFIGHNVACLLATMCLVYFIGHNVANAFMLLATKWPMRLHCDCLIHCFWPQSGPCAQCLLYINLFHHISQHMVTFQNDNTT